MRRLFLMRHARPVPTGGLPDFERELAPAGRVDAARVGRWLREQAPLTGVLSSPATRCVQTAQVVLEAMELPDPSEVTILDQLGMEDGGACTEVVEARAGTLLVVSHQPTIVGLGAALLRTRGAPLDLRPAHVARLVDSGAGWTLEGVLDPGRGG